MLYVLAMWVSGITQGLMWRAFDDTGHLQYPDFLETVTRLVPMYWVRALGGSLYIAGVLLGAYNIFKTWKARPAQYEEIEVAVPPMIREAKVAEKQTRAESIDSGPQRSKDRNHLAARVPLVGRGEWTG